MLLKFINLLNKGQLTNRLVFAILFFTALFIRLPFFFRDYIDRDESTFILIGQSWVDGFLPYTELWDIKPPLTFLFFAAIITVFGKSFFAIRLAGTLIVGITAFFTYKIGTTLTTKKVAFWSSLACIALQSMFGSIQGVMSEHICMAFLTPAVYLIIKYKNWSWIALSGLLMGIAIMVKLNMAYTILFMGLYLIYYYLKQREYRNGSIAVTLYGLGIIFVILLTIVPYYLEGNVSLWWKSVIVAPLDYANARRYSIFKMLPTLLVILLFFFVSWWKKYLDFKNQNVQILFVAVLGVLYAFLKGGRINSHYLIQLYPILIVLVGIVISKITFLKRLKINGLYFVLLLFLPVESYLEYGNIIQHKIERGSFYNGEGITVPQYLLKNNIDTKNILFLGYHIGYWWLDKKPPTKAATHPSNICKSEMFSAYDNERKTGVEEITFIMEEMQPATVVIRENKSIFDPKLVDENAYINAYLAEHYSLLTTVDKAQIYSLKR